MKLLEPEKVEKASTGEQRRLQKSVNDLRDEEVRSVSDLNRTKDENEKEKQRIKEETDAFVKSEHERALKAKQEADAIEAFRKDSLSQLLKPIGDLQQKAEDAIRAAEAREADCDRKEKDVAEDRAKNFELAEDLADRKDDLDEKDRELGKRETKIIAEETRLKESAETLAKNWSEYHITVRDTNFKLEAQTRILDDREKALGTYAETLRQSRSEIENDKLTLKSRYKALESAIAEFEEKKKNHGTSS